MNTRNTLTTLTLLLLLSAAFVSCDKGNDDNGRFSENGVVISCATITGVPVNEDSVYLFVTDEKGSGLSSYTFKDACLKVCKKDLKGIDYSVGLSVKFNIVKYTPVVCQGLAPIGHLNTYCSCSISNVKLTNNTLDFFQSNNIVTTIVGNWYVESYSKGFGGTTSYNKDELICGLHKDGTVKVSFENTTGTFVNYGIFHCSSENSTISINGEDYFFSINDSIMQIDGGSAFDGSSFTLKRTK